MSNSIIIIPSRLAATRLPQKPLIKINNKTLIMHVYEKALQSQIGEVYVATCDEEIASEVRKNGGKFIMTDKNHTTGTDRIFEASQKLNLKDIDFIMNIQGDEPMINPSDIKNLKLKKRYLITQKKVVFFCIACQGETKLRMMFFWEKIPMSGNKH